MDTTISSTTVDAVEQPDVLARNIRVGSRIWSASQAFFFLAFFFAFLYLRALNTNGLWRGWPHHHPSPSLALGFGPTDAAYASVFVGWSGLFALFLLGTSYWLVTVIGDVTRVGSLPEVRAAMVDGAGFVLLVLAGIEIAAFIL